MAIGGETTCCLDSADGNIKKSINGISRALTFSKKTDKDGKVLDPVIHQIYEGYLTNANPDKFGRFIYSTNGQSGSFTGYF